MENYLVTVLPGHWRFGADPAASLLASAEAGGVLLPSACRNGTCRTCICHLDAGAVRYLVEWPGLSADEKREGAILPCVAVPLSDCTLTAAAARRA